MRTKGQREKQELWKALDLSGNTFPGYKFSETAQLYSRVRGTKKMGMQAGVSPNLQKVMCYYHIV